MIGSSAMVLAAGLGLRMRPLTDTLPKPLVQVAGQSIIDHVFDRLREAGIERAVVNVHYLPERMECWAARQSAPKIIISDERAGLLDTGGGVVKALPHLGSDPFFVLNGDSFWADGAAPAMQRLRLRWPDVEGDCLLLLCPVGRAVGYDGEGDFNLDGEGRVTRRPAGEKAAYVFAGCYLASLRLFSGAPQGKFSTNLLWDRAIAERRLFGLVHDGLWLHIGAPEAIPVAERALKR